MKRKRHKITVEVRFYEWGHDWGEFRYLCNFNTIRIPIFIELQLFIRTVVSTVSSKFGSVVCDKPLDIGLCLLSGGLVELTVQSLHRSPPCRMVHLSLCQHLCPKVRLILSQSTLTGLNTSLFWTKFLPLAWQQGLRRRSSSFSPVFSVTLLLPSRNFGGRRRLATKEMKTWPVGQERRVNAVRSWEWQGIRTG